MGVKILFGCEHCQARPDRAMQRALERRLRDGLVGRFLDAQPGGWLIWTAGGPFGSRRYACDEHRAELVEWVRMHHGSRGAGTRNVEPLQVRGGVDRRSRGKRSAALTSARGTVP